MNILLVGPGPSAIEYQDYVEFNNFDLTIGCRHWLSDPAWSFDYVALPGIIQINWVKLNFPQYRSKIITGPSTSSKARMPQTLPWGNQYHTIEGIQTKWAVMQKPETITTVGYDLMYGKTLEHDCPVWRRDNPVQTHNISREYCVDKSRRARGVVNGIQRIHHDIEWRHMEPRHIKQPLHSFLEKKQGILEQN